MVCAAYVGFLISERRPHLLMAVSLLLCILHLQIITTQHAIILICRPVVGYCCRSQNVLNLCSLKGEKKTHKLDLSVFSPLIVSLSCFCSLLHFGCLFSNRWDITPMSLLLGTVYFLRCVQWSPEGISHSHKQMLSKCMGFFFFFSFHLT